MTDQPAAPPTLINDEEAEHLVDAYEDAAELTAEQKAAGMMADDYLLRAYQRTDGESGNPEADALLTEIERRGLDV